jgi:hypothetical protein
MTGDSRLDCARGKRRAGAFSQPHIEVEQRRLAEAAENPPMLAFRGDMTGLTMIERGRMERL